jgi:large subunit ribosomal protein L18
MDKKFLLRKKRNSFNAKRRNRSGRVRLLVSKTGKHIYASLIDLSGKVLKAFSTLSLDDKYISIETSKEVGVLIGKAALDLGVKEVYFDRGAFSYHGRIKSLADGARSVGLVF